MNEPYLEVTFRHGCAVAAYLYLGRTPADKSVRSQRVEPGLVIDLAASGRPIGIEMTAPGKLSVAAVNGVLEELGLAPLPPADLAPLLAAQALSERSAPLLSRSPARAPARRPSG